jgi:hypothetical protein
MGYVTQGKPLPENHPFFRRAETRETLKLYPSTTKLEVEDEDGDDGDDVDEVGAKNLMGAGIDEVSGDESDGIEYDSSEMYSGEE